MTKPGVGRLARERFFRALARRAAFPRYVTDDISRNIGEAKDEVVARTRELYDSGATLEHFVMQCAFNSFEVKNSQVQSMITGDINNEKLVKPGMNIQALASKYATFLSTINAQKGTGKINISMRKKRWCENCKSKTIS